MEVKESFSEINDFHWIPNLTKITKLPDEMLLHIFNLIKDDPETTRKDIINWRQVCRLFNEIGTMNDQELRKLPIKIWSKIFSYLESPKDCANIKLSNSTFYVFLKMNDHPRLKLEDEFQLSTKVVSRIDRKPLVPLTHSLLSMKKRDSFHLTEPSFILVDQDKNEYTLQTPLGFQHIGIINFRNIVKCENKVVIQFCGRNPGNQFFLQIYDLKEEGRITKFENVLSYQFFDKDYIVFNDNDNVKVCNINNGETIFDFDFGSHQYGYPISHFFADCKFFVETENGIYIYNLRDNGALMCIIKRNNPYYFIKSENFSNEIYKNGYLALISKKNEELDNITIWDIKSGKVFDKDIKRIENSNKRFVEFNLDGEKKDFIIRINDYCFDKDCYLQHHFTYSHTNPKNRNKKQTSKTHCLVQ